ncbi:MAG: aminodeoxychorismate synthase component I [Cyclobacteriaceae bacterium]|nr:aminodeoxychorismate synthase component I [Cyclobacteriaceae bacterium]
MEYLTPDTQVHEHTVTFGDGIVSEFIAVVNDWGRRRIPFLFITDFELKKPLAFPLDHIDSGKILYDINGFSNASPQGPSPLSASAFLHKHPIPEQVYREKYNKVFRHLAYGDTYLANLTIPTRVELSCALHELFHVCRAKYKLLYEDQFLVFSPETFIRIDDGIIRSFPMKGTIDAGVPNAREKILSDQKELAEHVTIVDLIRNDLSQVATGVTVPRFRYVEEIRTTGKNLLQVSSEVAGRLPDDYHSRLGEILIALLPAGSVSGAPKRRTLEVIREAEESDRGYFTGVFGYHDGNRLDCGVMIRYIERQGDGWIYRSGGGITTQSVPEAEYQEAIDKVYVPFD